MTLMPDAADRFWRHVMGDVYQAVPQGPDLTPIERAALEPLRLAWADLAPEHAWYDRDWGVTSDRSDDAAWRIQPLTIDRVELFAERVWADERDHDGAWSLKPDVTTQRAREAAEDRTDWEAKGQP